MPEYIQEQIRQKQQMTREERQALIEKQRLRDPGEQVPFAVSEREYIMKSMLRDIQRKKSE